MQTKYRIDLKETAPDEWKAELEVLTADGYHDKTIATAYGKSKGKALFNLLNMWGDELGLSINVSKYYG